MGDHPYLLTMGALDAAVDPAVRNARRDQVVLQDVQHDLSTNKQKKDASNRQHHTQHHQHTKISKHVDRQHKRHNTQPVHNTPCIQTNHTASTTKPRGPETQAPFRLHIDMETKYFLVQSRSTHPPQTTENTGGATQNTSVDFQGFVSTPQNCKESTLLSR